VAPHTTTSSAALMKVAGLPAVREAAAAKRRNTDEALMFVRPDG
jgi:hypothetical protein